jgi:hypothetical protein
MAEKLRNLAHCVNLLVRKRRKDSAGKLAAAAKKPGKMGQRARLAQTLKGLKK